MMRLGKRRPRGWGALICLSGCLYDADDRCGEHQDYKDEMCVCAEGYTLKENVCEEIPAPPDAGEDAGEQGDAGTSQDGGRLPYTGQKEPCTSHGECAGFDANYCNPIFRVCQVQGCTESSCDPGYMCIDLGMYVPGEPAVCLDPSDVMQ
jgi:hypothetical protein